MQEISVSVSFEDSLKNFQDARFIKLKTVRVKTEWLTCKNLQVEWLTCKNLQAERLKFKFLASSFRLSSAIIGYFNVKFSHSP